MDFIINELPAMVGYDLRTGHPDGYVFVAMVVGVLFIISVAIKKGYRRMRPIRS